VTEILSGNIYLLYKMTDFYWGQILWDTFKLVT